MLKIKEAIVVEGRYDKNALSQLVDTVIVETGGFQVFKEKDRLNMLRLLAQRRGLIVLTDSDGAGFVIRNYLKGTIPPGQVKHAYIPDIPGKEKRKAHPGKEGKLGVEGMPPSILEDALRRAGATILNEGVPSPAPRQSITKADLFRDGLTGGAGSGEKRRVLERRLGLPQRLSTNALLQVLNSLMSYEEYTQLMEKQNSER